jgi:hypothetical protein
MNANAICRLSHLAGALGVLTLALAGVFAPAAAGEDAISKKLNRQIGVMEKIIDEALIESPNYLVQARQNTHGIYLEEFGMLFSFEASLFVGAREEWWEKLKRFKIKTEGGKTIIELGQDDEDEDEDLDEEEWEAKLEEEQEEHYAKGKEELTTVLLDYGDTLTGLRDEQTVAIAAFLSKGSLFIEDGTQTLVVKAKMSDLRAFAKGSLSERTMRDRISYQEY